MERTRACERMVACPSPQSSVQMTSYSPTCVGSTTVRVVTPLTASCFIRHSGTQNEWITSFEVIMNSIAWSTGTTSSPVVSGRPPSTSMSG